MKKTSASKSNIFIRSYHVSFCASMKTMSNMYCGLVMEKPVTSSFSWKVICLFLAFPYFLPIFFSDFPNVNAYKLYKRNFPVNIILSTYTLLV